MTKRNHASFTISSPLSIFGKMLPLTLCSRRIALLFPPRPVLLPPYNGPKNFPLFGHTCRRIGLHAFGMARWRLGRHNASQEGCLFFFSKWRSCHPSGNLFLIHLDGALPVARMQRQLLYPCDSPLPLVLQGQPVRRKTAMQVLRTYFS